MSTGSKDGAFLADAKLAGGVDSNGNEHPLNCDTTGTLQVTGVVDVIPGAIFEITGEVEVKNDSGNPIPVAISQIGTANRVATVVDFVVTNDNYTVPATGSSYTNEIPHRSFAVQVIGVGNTPTAWNVVLEGSIDGTHFTPFLTHTQTLGETILWSSANQYASITYRTKLVSVTLTPATSLTVTVLATT